MDVNSLNELKQIFKDIKPNDIKIVQNFLDMDKLTNINVLKGLKNFFKILYLIFDYPHKHYTFKHFEI